MGLGGPSVPEALDRLLQLLYPRSRIFRDIGYLFQVRQEPGIPTRGPDLLKERFKFRVDEIGLSVGHKEELFV